MCAYSGKRCSLESYESIEGRRGYTNARPQSYEMIDTYNITLLQSLAMGRTCNLLFSLAVFITLYRHTSSLANISTDKAALLTLKSHLSFDPNNILARNWSSSSPVNCNSYNPRCKSIFSIAQNTRCFCCARLRQCDRKIKEKEEKRSCGGETVVEVFFKSGAASFMITDDLQVMPASTASLTALFGKLGVSDKSEIEAKTVEVGTQEVLQLLKFSLLSKTALTNMVLDSQGSWLKDISKFEDNQTAKLDKKTMSQNTNSMNLKLIVSKSKKKVLYAEAGVKLVDFLFSFLVFPLGAVVKHLGGNSRLGCIDNLYKGAAELSLENYIKSEECKNMLLSPKLFPYSGFDSHILNVEEEYPKYRYDDDWGLIELVRNTNKSEGSSIVNEEEASDLAINILDPKSPTGETIKGEGYLKGPATFMIMDNLIVTPFSPTTIITQLNQMEVSTSDVEERTVTVGKDEALNLLKASLISTTVLNDVFNIREPYPKVMLKV